MSASFWSFDLLRLPLHITDERTGERIAFPATKGYVHIGEGASPMVDLPLAVDLEVVEVCAQAPLENGLWADLTVPMTDERRRFFAMLDDAVAYLALRFSCRCGDSHGVVRWDDEWTLQSVVSGATEMVDVETVTEVMKWLGEWSTEPRRILMSQSLRDDVAVGRCQPILGGREVQ